MVPIPAGAMGAVLGAKHATLTRIKESHGCAIAVDPGGAHVTVSGSAASVAAACDDIARIISHVRDRPPPASAAGGTAGGNNASGGANAGAAAGASGDQMSVTVSARGCLAAIIGSKGATVKRIQMESGARIDKLQETLELRVTGAPAAVRAACAAIDSVVDRTLRDRADASGAPRGGGAVAALHAAPTAAEEWD